jgi:pyrimidine-nucleoside phosphorylase
MRMVDIIESKKNGEVLTKQEINFFIRGYVKGEIPDYQVSALLMAIIFKGMEKSEIFDLTEAMLNSGDVVDLSSIKGVKVDKHSTGGVGDKVSLVLGPMVASCGVKLAKMSGRGLGHTGGTLDKLESIPGFKTRIQIPDFINQVNSIGLAIIGQTDNLDPADKKLYALRDVTGTVNSMALIASSIMSKKLASGADTILLDVKFGEGAFMKTLEDAKALASLMVEIGKHFGKDTRAEISDMNEPLGYAVGNILEVKEAIDALHGKGPSDLRDICLSSGSTMLVQAKVAENVDEAKNMLMFKLSNGTAFEKFRQMVIAQGGDVSYIDHPEKFPVAMYKADVKSTATGYISRINALDIGLDAMKLGAGRETADDKIDYAAGIVLRKKVGDKVTKGDILATLYTERPNFEDIQKDIAASFNMSADPIRVHPIIWDSVK